ncbi:hypothetical protein BDV96DRAFT_303931 [Lophiotrema nucula]|uniref:Ribosomal protein/NADH dehydrogenase domain-containing protein n=1 Tax=Lophiotrema nucula TaxID=690887 RepID=A0A6A5YJ72_9PLEO|nr:hypothetical protein BDV96DRAFT_303931 [Lophiotrema nucula]
MEFHGRINGGHHQARKFWREMLPRIKYRNPAVSVQIQRHTDPSGPAKLYVYTKTPSPSQPTPAAESPPSSTPNPRNTGTPDTSEPTHTIEMKLVPESQILEELIDKTGAELIHPTEEEHEQLRDIADYKVRAEADRVEVREKLTKQRREEELLRLARGEITAAN